jgi:hypothetical protein
MITLTFQTLLKPKVIKINITASINTVHYYSYKDHISFIYVLYLVVQILKRDLFAFLNGLN